MVTRTALTAVMKQSVKILIKVDKDGVYIGGRGNWGDGGPEYPFLENLFHCLNGLCKNLAEYCPGLCILQIWRCDGDKDCSDSSDETESEH